MPNRKDRGEVFRALADEHRRTMLTMLSKRPHAATELGAPFALSAPAVSQHLAVLRAAGLVDVEPVGKYRVYKLAAGPLAEAATWLHDLDSRARTGAEQLEKVVRRLEAEPGGERRRT